MGFSVACMARESTEVLNAFFRHYLSANAERIFLYYDGDLEDLEIESSEKIVIIFCNEEFWSTRQLRRPDAVVPRQRMIFNDAFSINTSDWLLICDADELVMGNIAHALDRVPSKFEFVKLRPYEAVWIKGENVEVPFANSTFRKPMPRFLGKALSFLIYGVSAKYFHSGIASHTQGKSIVRKSGDFSSMGIHAPRGPSANKGIWLDWVFPDADVRLYHFSAITYSRWKTKLSGRADGSRQDSSVDHVSRFSPAQAAVRTAFNRSLATGKERELFECIFVLKPRQAWKLKLLGLLEYKT